MSQVLAVVRHGGLMLLMLLCMMKVGGSIELNNGVSCEVPLEISANTHMCFKAEVRSGVVGYEVQTREVQVLTRPCPSCFPVTEVVNMTYEVPVYGDICSLKQLWRFPRKIKYTITDVRILTTPGLLRKRQYPHRILCIWNVKCRDDLIMYFNATQHSTQGQSMQSTGNVLCPDYIQVKYGNTTLQSCGSVPHQMLVNQVKQNEIQVVFRSDDKISDKGFRLDTVCFHPQQTSPQSQDSEVDMPCTQGQANGHGSKIMLSEEEQMVVRQALQVHFELFAATDACSRGVENCAKMEFRDLVNSIEQTLEVVGSHRQACSPLVRSLVNRTLDLLTHYT